MTCSIPTGQVKIRVLSQIANLFKFASQIDFDQDAFAECFNSGKYTQKVIDKAREASAAGITSTPTFLVNGQTVGLNDLLSVLDKLVNQ